MISDEQIRQIGEIDSLAEDGEFSRMLGYRIFGFRRIKGQRPLRMSLHNNDEPIARLKEGKVWTRLTPYVGQVRPFVWVETFVEEDSKSDRMIGKVGKPFFKTMIGAFRVRNQEGEAVLDANGDRVPDPDLTDYGNVPLLENVRSYFAREVLSHMPDAWIDESFQDDKDKEIGRVGYEINFNRFFYKDVPPRRLERIDAELKQVEKEIAELLGEVTE